MNRNASRALAGPSTLDPMLSLIALRPRGKAVGQ